MPQRILGLIVACALVLAGGASVAVPAAAAPKAPAAAKAAKAAKVAKDKPTPAESAAKARAAKAKAQARVARQVAQSGPRAAATAKAATAARARAAAATKVAAAARSKAVAAARAAATAQAKAASVAKSDASATVKRRASAAAKKAVRSSTKAAKLAKARAAAATKARARAATKTKVAVEARLNYVALAGPRAAVAARAAATSSARAARAARVNRRAQAKAAAAARVAATARAHAAAVAKSKAPVKAKKKAAKAAKAATRVSVKATADARAIAGRAARAAALAKVRKKAAARAKTAAGPNPQWAPKDGVVFNNPRGTKKQKLAIINQINQAIDATPAGGEIRMAMYLFDIGSVAKKLIAASRRGVSVQILIDDGESNKHIRKVRKASGTNKAASTFVATCERGCMSDGASVIHAKFYLFSVAGKARRVSMISSANPYTGNTFKSWNNNHTIVGDPKIYDSLSKYFTDMLSDKQNLNYYRVTSSGKYTIYLYPQALRRPEDFVVLNVLNQTTCRTTAKGYGSDGRTLIRVANWGWTGARLDIAQRLWKLHDSGCKVQVMINKGRISRSVLAVLLKRSKGYGKMKVYDAWYDGNNNDIAGLYVHHKAVTINGLLGGKNVKMTWTGSQNFTALGTLANNDIILRVDDPAVTDAYNRNFAYIRKHHTKRMYTVPYVTRRPQV